MPEEVITEMVEDVVAELRNIAFCGGTHSVSAEAATKYADRVQAAHKAEMKEVIDLLQKALDVCWKAECYFRWLNEQKKEGKANA